MSKRRHDPFKPKWNFPSVNLNKADEWKLRKVRITYFRSSRHISVSLNFEHSLAHVFYSHERLNDTLYMHFVNEPDQLFELRFARVTESTLTVHVTSRQGMTASFRNKAMIRIASRQTGRVYILKDYEYAAV